MSLDTLFAALNRLFVLPPRSLLGESTPIAVQVDADHYEQSLAEVQRLRGGVYLEDGAIPPSVLDMSGRHLTEFDYENWHLFMTSGSGRVTACIRLRLHDAGIAVHQLKVYELVERMPLESRITYCSALESFLQKASVERIRVGESGGWAVSPEARRNAGTIVLLLAAWALYQILGDALVFSAATTRHRSADILKGIGGLPLRHQGRILPRFFDLSYGCEMEIVTYDIRRPAQKYAGLVDRIKAHLMGQSDVARSVASKSIPFGGRAPERCASPMRPSNVPDGAGDII